jgi:LAO/AO transport system kinase
VRPSGFGLSPEQAHLVLRLSRGDRVALARVLTLIERDRALIEPLDAALSRFAGNAYAVGVTGAPGAGKSTLVGALLADRLRRNQRTAVLALDPVSPFSQGAILGDRMRMESVAGDARLFVRSLGARSARGGLSLVAPFAARALDAAGWPMILIETVGVGQTELDIVDAALTSVVVLTPGMGDEVQAIKAGLMEVGDVFVVNKADCDGAEIVRRDVERITSAGPRGWRPPVLSTVALEGRGIGELWEAIDAHRAHLEETGAITERRQGMSALALRSLVEDQLRERLAATIGSRRWAHWVDGVTSGEGEIGVVAEKILKCLLAEAGEPAPAEVKR